MDTITGFTDFWPLVIRNLENDLDAITNLLGTCKAIWLLTKTNARLKIYLRGVFLLPHLKHCFEEELYRKDPLIKEFSEGAIVSHIPKGEIIYRKTKFLKEDVAYYEDGFHIQGLPYYVEIDLEYENGRSTSYKWYFRCLELLDWISFDREYENVLFGCDWAAILYIPKVEIGKKYHLIKQKDHYLPTVSCSMMPLELTCSSHQIVNVTCGAMFLTPYKKHKFISATMEFELNYPRGDYKHLFLKLGAYVTNVTQLSRDTDCKHR